MAIGEDVGLNVGEDTGSSGSAYVGITPVINNISASAGSNLLTINLNTGVKTGLLWVNGFALSVDGTGKTINSDEVDATGAGNGILIFGTNGNFSEGESLGLVYLDSQGDINSILGDIQLADSTTTYGIPDAPSEGVIYSTDFSEFPVGTLPTETQPGGFRWRVATNAGVSDSRSYSGGKSLAFSYPIKNSNGFSQSEQPFLLGGNYPEIWMRYYLYVPNNFVYVDPDRTNTNNKTYAHLWGGGPDGQNGALRDGPWLGTSWWYVSESVGKTSVFLGARVDGEVTLSHHSYAPSDKWYATNTGEGRTAINADDKGKWQEIVMHFKYATIANNDGVFEVWKTVNGVETKIHDIQDGAWYATMQNSTVPADGFDVGYLMGWANAGYNEKTVFNIDNFIVSTEPL